MRTIETGIGATLDAARKGMPGIARTYALGVNKEGARLPLAQGVGLAELRQGYACSRTDDGAIQPFDLNLPFAGFVVTLHQDREVMVAVDRRGAVLLKIENLQASSLGKPIYALSPNRFGLDGGVAIGQIIAIENLERGLAIVGFKPADDARPFSMDGRMNERQR
jgi:hypothetical protein